MLWNVDASHIILFCCNAAQCISSGKVQPSIKDECYGPGGCQCVSYIIAHYTSSFISAK
jgi:hypothetical protein